MFRKVGIILIVVGVLAAVFQLFGIRFPSLKWFFVDNDLFNWIDGKHFRRAGGPVTGWIACALLALAGLLLALLGPRDFQFSPQTRRQIQRFRSLRRGYWSLWILAVLVLLAMADNLVVGDRALVVKYQGKLHFPALVDPIPPTAFGGEDENELTDYRVLEREFAEAGEGNWVIMPPVPWSPISDSDTAQRAILEVNKDGLFALAGRSKPYSGKASIFFADSPEMKRQEWRFRRGKKDGPMEGWDREGNRVEHGEWKGGEEIFRDIEDPEVLMALGGAELTPLTVVRYPPVPPSWKDRHFLGTDTNGRDILAQLYGGFQILLQANVLYLAITYAIGISLGCAMGYFGGSFDLVVQRLIEVLSNLPFLYVVIIVASVIERPSMPILVGVLCIFSWIGMTYYLRTATYREKARDYVAAAKLMGAGTGRVIFRHVLPNTIAIVVTLLPFKAISVIGSLTALDFLGFGLPEELPSWGRLLNEGSDNLSSPWIVSSAFAGTVIVLVLVTFVGEAIREAFDPKKFTTYQ